MGKAPAAGGRFAGLRGLVCRQLVQDWLYVTFQRACRPRATLIFRRDQLVSQPTALGVGRLSWKQGRARKSKERALAMGQGATKFNVCVTAGPDAPDMLFHFRIKEEDVTVGQSALRPGASALDLAVQAALLPLAGPPTHVRCRSHRGGD